MPNATRPAMVEIPDGHRVCSLCQGFPDEWKKDLGRSCSPCSGKGYLRITPEVNHALIRSNIIAKLTASLKTGKTADAGTYTLLVPNGGTGHWCIGRIAHVGGNQWSGLSPQGYESSGLMDDVRAKLVNQYVDHGGKVEKP